MNVAINFNALVHPHHVYVRKSDAQITFDVTIRDMQDEKVHICIISYYALTKGTYLRANANANEMQAQMPKHKCGSLNSNIDLFNCQ